MGHDEMLQVLKEKMRLEGQLESLSSEANQVISHMYNDIAEMMVMIQTDG